MKRAVRAFTLEITVYLAMEVDTHDMIFHELLRKG